MFKRQIASELKKLSEGYPVVTVTGPRQSGKTTLVQLVFPKKPYVNLEAHDVRERAIADPRGFLATYPNGAILDEIQQAPLLLSYIQVIVDEADQEGMFILTGSHQMELHSAVAQSLAGRTALLTLLPLSLSEIEQAKIRLTLEEAIYCGGYPRLFRKHLEPTVTYRDYVSTYLERDLRQLIHVKELDLFQRFLRLCAGRIGQILNFASLANDVGVSSNTIKHWLSILEASFIIVRLQPYYENLGKRMIKSPKLYFTDVGLACYLLNIQSADQVGRDPLYGSLMENLILLELMKHRLNQGRDHQLYFYRDAAGLEVDFLFKSGHELIPIEVKGGHSFHRGLLRNLQRFEKLAPDRCPYGALIYAGDAEQNIHNIQLLNYRHAPLAYIDPRSEKSSG